MWEALEPAGALEPADGRSGGVRSGAGCGVGCKQQRS